MPADPSKKSPAPASHEPTALEAILTGEQWVLLFAAVGFGIVLACGLANWVARLWE